MIEISIAFLRIGVFHDTSPKPAWAARTTGSVWSRALALAMATACSAARATPSGVTSAGNAAGTGARIALLNRAAREEIERVVRDVEKVETAVEPRFQEHFVHAMAIPHETDPYERLARSVPLPARRTAPTARRPRRRPAEAGRKST